MSDLSQLSLSDVSVVVSDLLQLSLSDVSVVAHARTTDPETSRAAARSLTVETLRESQAAVLRVFTGHHRMTDSDLEEMYEVYRVSNPYGFPRQSPSGLRTRRSELAGAGLVVDSGQRKRLPSGRSSIVWEIP